jgi:heme exporter protein C
MTSDTSRFRRLFWPGYWALTGVLVAVGLALVAFYAPIGTDEGSIQKTFYFHLPVAMTTFLACFVVFLASLWYLWQRAAWSDDLAHAAAEVAALYCSVVLLTGMIWAKAAWGQWWEWSPRLTLSLVLWLLYVVYLVLRPRITSPDRRAVVCAVYGVIAFLDVPLVYFSVQLMPEEMHTASVELSPAMRQTMFFWMLPVVLLCLGFIRARYSVLRRAGKLHPTDRGDHDSTADTATGATA